MAGTRAGGIKATKTMKARYGEEVHSIIGRSGGVKKGVEKGFKSKKVGADGLTGAERAKVVGAKGGQISRRPKPTPYDDRDSLLSS